MATKIFEVPPSMIKIQFKTLKDQNLNLSKKLIFLYDNYKIFLLKLNLFI